MEEAAEVAARIAVAAGAGGGQVAVAESLTGGLVATELAKAPDAGTWFAGGVVAYLSRVKHELLSVPPGPVVSETAARAMAEGVARLTGATHTAAVTGVGGPDKQDGQPVGTVWIASHTRAGTQAHRLELTGEPASICRQAATHCLLALESVLHQA